jgi:glycosyltransferase involved in cell wall biosynthesis
MKVLHILPELQIGGVERHVIDLANEQVKRNFQVLVVSAGGQMESQLKPEVMRRHLPVHLKNPITGFYCAVKIAHWIKNEHWNLIHAHSRVPAWIAEWAAHMAGVPYIVTAHVDFGTKTHWIYAPYRQADRVICVSRAVQNAMKDCFYDNTTVIVNGIKRPREYWNADVLNDNKLLFVGRLSSVKGLQDVLRVLPVEGNWTLDVVGDGPQKEEWKRICTERGIIGKVFFRGYSDQVEHYMAHSSLLLFPSYTEGMPLTLAQAILIGIPVLASDIQPVTEMKGNADGLIPCGSQQAWKTAIDNFLVSHRMPGQFPKSSVPTLERMVDQITDVYSECLGKNTV